MEPNSTDFPIWFVYYVSALSPSQQKSNGYPEVEVTCVGSLAQAMWWPIFFHHPKIWERSPNLALLRKKSWPFLGLAWWVKTRDPKINWRSPRDLQIVGINKKSRIESPGIKCSSNSSKKILEMSRKISSGGSWGCGSGIGGKFHG